MKFVSTQPKAATKTVRKTAPKKAEASAEEKPAPKTRRSSKADTAIKAEPAKTLKKQEETPKTLKKQEEAPKTLTTKAQAPAAKKPPARPQRNNAGASLLGTEPSAPSLYFLPGRDFPIYKRRENEYHVCK